MSSSTPELGIPGASSLPTALLASPEAESLVAGLAEELARRWRQGAPCQVEELLALHPELAGQPQMVVPLIYEEICQRQENGQEPSVEEYGRRFPHWQRQVEMLFECQRLLGPAPAVPLFPAAGETLGDFRLLSELDRGRHGRVFLATQPALADRIVVLKLSPLAGVTPGSPAREHLSLARLQHTHIVPLLFVQEERARHLLILCMPYFGGASLSRLLGALPPGQSALSSGRQVLETLNRLQTAAALGEDQRPGLGQEATGNRLPIVAHGPARQFLAGASAVQAVCWIGACLAEALDYAHQQGLLHLDVKAANVLLTAAGQPMLLDFHLAREPLPAGSAAPDWLGGTSVYMAPEQQAALEAVRAGRPLVSALDGRADVYSLGILLSQLLGGALSASEARSLRRRNPSVSVGLADIINRCLAANPPDRYPSAAALATDLRRHLADLPLQGVRNRSWGERLRKWHRRRPHGLALLGMLAAALTATAVAAVVTLNQAGQQREAVHTALREGQRQLRQQQYTEALATLHRGQELARSLAGSQELKQELRRQVRLAEQAHAARELHQLANRIRFWVGDEFLAPQRLQALETRCRGLWDKRELIASRLGADLDAKRQQQIQADLLDLAVLWADLRVRLAAGGEGRSAREEAVRLLDQAEALLGASAVLRQERRRHAAGLEPANSATARVDPPPRTAWEHSALGRSLLRSGRLDQAYEQLILALDKEPQGLWQNYYLGLCAYRLKRYQEGVVAFSTCVALAPEAAGVFYNRALALAALGSADQALRDYDRALKLDPRLTSAAQNRGLLHYRAGRHALALVDLHQALTLGADPATTWYNLALVHLARRDKRAALSSIEHALQANPKHQQARRLRDSLQRQP
jgi:serine/threonine protein kinase/Flp pilus assembly protein TadD